MDAVWRFRRGVCYCGPGCLCQRGRGWSLPAVAVHVHALAGGRVCWGHFCVTGIPMCLRTVSRDAHSLIACIPDQCRAQGVAQEGVGECLMAAGGDPDHDLGYASDQGGPLSILEADGGCVHRVQPVPHSVDVAHGSGVAKGEGRGGVRIPFPLWPEGEGRRLSNSAPSFAQHMGGGGFEFTSCVQPWQRSQIRTGVTEKSPAFPAKTQERGDNA